MLLRLKRAFIVATRSQTRKSFAPWPTDAGRGQRKTRVVEMETMAVYALAERPGSPPPTAASTNSSSRPCPVPPG